jgi:putative ABC transport system permease protein
MSLWRIAWSYLWNRRFTTAMTILSVALGVALISTVLTLREETRKRFEEEGQAFDIVVGEKGNPLQLVLSTVYFLDSPTGNILYSDYERLKEEEEVAAVFPIGMGDTFRGARIIGTTTDLFEFDWTERTGRNPYTLAEGRYFEAPFEAIIGAAVATDTGLSLGRRFIGTHGFVDMPGMEHDDHPYTVVGVLEVSGTPNDRAIFCDIESVWEAHAHHDDDDHDHEDCDDPDHHHHHHGESPKEITAALVKLHSPALRPSFRERVNRTYNAMAAIPINEIQKLYEQLLGTAKAVLLAIGYLVVVISSISILIGLYMAILQRKRDLAIMRALGASRGEIFGAVLIEAFWVTVLGLCAGWFLGTAVCWTLGQYLGQKLGFPIGAISMTSDLITAYSAVLLMGIVAGLLPAWQAYRSNVARDLAEL